MKFWEIFSFELYYQFRRPLLWIFFATVVGLISLVISEIAEYAQTVEHILLYSPMVIAELSGYVNKFGLLIIAALVGDGAMREINSRMDSLLYTSSVKKSTYVGARFLGTFAMACILLLLALPLSLILARSTQELEPALLGEFNPLAFIHASLFLTLPNAFIASAILYSLVLYTRHAMAAFVGGVILFVISTFTLEIFAGNWNFAKLIDPSGITVTTAIRWSLTPLQINTKTIELKGFLLANRALWIGISLMIGMLAFFQFKMSYYTGSFGWKKVAPAKVQSILNEPLTPIQLSTAIRSFSQQGRMAQTRMLALQFYHELVMSPAGLLIPAITLYSFVLIPNLAEGPMGVPIVPTTERVTLYMHSSALQIFVRMLITLFAGQLIWRERDTRLNEISDAVPVPDGILLISKYVSLAFLVCTLQVGFMGAGMAIQLFAGYDAFNIPLYVQMLFGAQLVEHLTFAAVAMALHIIINQKYLGHLAVLLFYLYTLIAPRFGIEHKLLIFGSDTGLATSIFYEQTAFLLPWILFKLYWAGWAFLFILLAKQVWVRGREIPFKRRFQQVFNGLKQLKLLTGGFFFTAVIGGIVFYNTNILNEYKTKKQIISQQVEYERLYGKYKNSPQPHLTSTTLHVEFYPDKSEALVQGSYQLINKKEISIDSIHVALTEGVETSQITFNRKANLVLADNVLRHYIYLLGQPLHPGDSLQMTYRVHFRPEGFSNSGINTAVISNGSYFRNSEWLPAIGYQKERELSSEALRRENALPTRKVMRSLHDKEAIWDRAGRERIHFEVTVGTSKDQIAIAPGCLKKTWSKQGRQYFHYVADAPIQNMYHIYSADYNLRKSTWKGVDIQLYHHPENTLNLETIKQGMIGSLEYYSTNFSTYPFRQLTFIEYADPGTGGISFPGTIGYSTNFSLLNPEADARKFDLPFAVTAHEVAHQWWGHQLVPADKEGAPFLSESLAWYSALGVVEKVHGKEHLQNLLSAMRSEYLNPRSRAAVPLLQTVDGFGAYRKGPLAMYALREYVGEEKVNLALNNLLNEFKLGEPPYATSLDFYRQIMAVTPDSLQYLLKDLFETNTFWELETKAASLKSTEDGEWLVMMDVLARKVQVDHNDVETNVPMNDLIEVGVFGNDKKGTKKALYVNKHKIHSGANRIVVRVSQKPEEAGIDPRNLLIDTETNNNIRQIISGKNFN
jgi:hypothetical protein